MTASGDPLWQRIEAHEIGPPKAALTFTDRLARENRWSAEHAARVLLEYKRFCYLACTAGREVTPSDAVDQAWHLHLTYSRDYWHVFCPQVLQSDLHHGPTDGTLPDRTRFYAQYADTLKAYEDTFGEPPPPDIWPDARRRFLIDPKHVRVNPADAMIMAWPPAGALLLAAMVLAALGGWLLGGYV
ncbi:MAG: hypothetical protein AAF127_03215 [Pseudomonadota bacterium]